MPHIYTVQGDFTTFEGHFEAAQDGLRLDRALAECISELSRERIQALLRDGRVHVAGTAVSQASSKAVGGAHFVVHVPAATASPIAPQDIPLQIVYEDDDLIVVDKHAGLVVHPAAGHPDGTLVNALLHHCNGQLSGIGGVARPGIVHRIDKDTSGILVATKTDVAHRGLAIQFADHSIERRYAAVVQGHPTSKTGTIDGAIGRSSHDRKKMAVVGPNDSHGRGKSATTHFTLIEILRDAALVECRLETGRTHQVRVHMASIGHPLVGDPVYGRTSKPLKDRLKALDFRRQALHAAHLGFIHPVSAKKLEFSSNIPADMQELLRVLRVK